MNAFIFTFVLLFFSVVGDVLLSGCGFILPLSAITIFYLAVSRHSLIVFPLACLSGIMLDQLLLYPYMLGVSFALLMTVCGVLWLINGEFSYGSIPHSMMVVFLTGIFIIVCYLCGIARNVQILNWSYALKLLLNLGINTVACFIFTPLLIKYGDIVAKALSIEPFSVARVNYIQKRKEL